MHITNGQVTKIAFDFSYRMKLKYNRMGIGDNGDFLTKVETFDGLGWQILVICLGWQILVIFFLSWHGWSKYNNSTLVM